MSKTIGILGLGIIGQAWARRYAAAGVLTGVWNRTPQPTASAWRDTPEAVASAADVVQIVVADPPAVEGVLTRILPQLGPGKIVVQSSTIDPASSARFATLVGGRGARYVEAPFTGSKPAAEEGKTVFYLGGETVDLDAVEPLLALISETRFRIGTREQASALKLAMNLNIAAQMETLAESLTIARRAGIGDDTFFAALAKNVSYSGVTKLKEPKLRTGDFSPQFSVKHMSKDMRLAVAMTAGADYPVLATVRARLQSAEARGMGDDDFSTLLRLL
ncbi:MAG: NAD(P)-dependent oxidoreductase [Opitutae bacterium]|nr:NAD(P)-dependent oxidoreductase [Opitutae bacterium]